MDSVDRMTAVREGLPHYTPDEVTELRPVGKPEALGRLLRECLARSERMDRAVWKASCTGSKAWNASSFR